MSKDTQKLQIKGEWWDEVYKQDPETGQLVLDYVTEVRTNTKMDAVAVLMAALMANDPTQGGILYHAQGRGDAGWGAVPPAVNTADTTLFDEAYRKVPDSIVFLDPSDVVVPGPTNVIRIRTVYGLAELAGETLREQALFGGDATATTDSGIIINTIRHDGIFKSGAVQLARNVKLTFS